VASSATTSRISEELTERAHLSPREVDVLEYLSRGLTATAIGYALRISPLTVRKHCENIYRKLDRHDRLLAVEEARRLGIIPTAGIRPA
jgi:DNA-binding NarL/FixJ family response regulator